MNEKVTFKGIWEVVKNTFSGFSNDNVTKLSASLAYYTVFSMGPLLIVIISLCGIFLGRDAAQGKIFHELDAFVGHDTALQLQDIIKSAAISGKGHIAAVHHFNIRRNYSFWRYAGFNKPHLGFKTKTKTWLA